jgi:hypothetical protein
MMKVLLPPQGTRGWLCTASDGTLAAFGFFSRFWMEKPILGNARRMVILKNAAATSHVPKLSESK